MIPKVIHYCWFSNDPKPKNVRSCIKSWKKHFKGYEIKCWDANSFDFDAFPFTKEALAARKWAFVSDFVRLYALYTEGGIYLDSDVQAFGNIDKWLENDLFTGIEKRGDTTDLFIEAAIIGASKGNPTIGKCLDFYKTRRFIQDDGSRDLTPIPTVVTPVFCNELGWQPVDETQYLKDNTVVFSSEVIANTESEIKPSMVLYHWNNRSWLDRTIKEKIYMLLKNIGLISPKRQIKINQKAQKHEQQ